MSLPIAPQLRGIAHQLREIKPAPVGLIPIIRQIEVLAKECEHRILMSGEHRMAVTQILTSLKDLGKGKPKFITRLDLFWNAIDRLNEVIEQFLPYESGEAVWKRSQ